MAAHFPWLDRRRLLLGVAGFAAPAAAQTPRQTADITFEIDENRLRALFGRRLGDNLRRLFPDSLVGDVAADAAGVTAKLRRAEQSSAVAAALPRLDPSPAPARAPGEGLTLVSSIGPTRPDPTRLRLEWSAASLDAQAALWRDRAKALLAKALAPRNPVLTDKDARQFVLAVAGMSRPQWLAWLGGRIDLFFPAVFTLAPVAAAAGPSTFSPRPSPFARGGLVAAVAVEGERLLGNEDDFFSAGVEGQGADQRLILDLARSGADLFAAKGLPSGDRAAYALMFDKALAALAVLDGPAKDGRLRLRIDKGLGAAELAEGVRVGGSAPIVKQVAARFG
ncbi:hypothetical protein M2322_002730 [Rhodoblastus acidophilus]|uniref:hypothetical protein n=1 Tax=Rhodoblastus acidophilus TaxID=1074 RepID=UPI00222479AA|nr:hypothetical protein [Rhodoblastus acidophilus]MCW2317176.1 hypothetical protein [Rhodoblastus acidophilus]